MAQHNEIEFEREFAEYLAAHGWLYSMNDTGYDKERALFPADVLGWLRDTQPEQVDKVIKPGSKDVAKQELQLLDRLVKVLDLPLANGGGTLNVLRNGFSHLSGKFAMCVFRPESTLNAKRNTDHAAVRLRVMRQVHFSTADNRSVDLVFFVNGLPVATAELKTDFTQSVADAITQYRATRLPKDPKTGLVQPLFLSGARALVHFAVSNDEVWMTTHLVGEKTHFLPFNRGTEDGGAGNLLNPNGSRSSYLWERVLQRDAWLNILGRLMYIKHESSTDPISGKTTKTATLRFPRFHQWEAVTELTAAVTAEGVGRRYLIQHSAGSGKTDSIAWTAHRMARLQVDNTKVFDSVIVVTDRNVLDAQLQDAIKQIDNDQGIVVAIDQTEATKAGGSKSSLLAKALTDGKLIIVVTIQTFPFAMAAIRQHKGLKGKKFAVIADEARSPLGGRGRRGALLPVRTDRRQTQSGPNRRGTARHRGRRGDRRRGDPGRRGYRPRRLVEHLLLRVHCHTERQDPRTVRAPAQPRRAAGTVSRVHDEAGDRRGLHPRCPHRLSQLHTGLPDRSEGGRRRARGRPGRSHEGGDEVGQDQPANHLPEVGDHRRTLPRERRPPARRTRQSDGGG